MFQQPDSIHHTQPSVEHVVAPQQEEVAVERHPYEALQHLPANATPAQTDSALRSLYSHSSVQRPVKVDTLQWNQETAKEPVAARDTIPLYYKDTFVAADSLIKTEYSGRLGISGVPVPYTMRSDSVLSTVVIVAILLTIYAMRRASKFFSFLLKNFFRVVRNDSSVMKEASSDVRNLLFMTFFTAIALALEFFYYCQEYISQTYITYSEYALMGIFLAEICGFICLELLLQKMVNAVFFQKEQREAWMTSKLLLYSLSGIQMIPLLLLVAYFGLSTENALTYTMIVLLLYKVCAFYKAFQIFFKKISTSLQFFLYLCTLELIPPMILWGVLLLTANYLKVNY